MPSAFAHAFVGASLVAFAPLPLRRARFALAAAAIAVLPDADVIGFRLGIGYGDALGHRGLTHSLFFALLLGGACAWAWARARPALTPQRLALAWLFVIACASHGLLDAFTDAGLGAGLLLPFDDTRYFAPFRPLETSPLSVKAFLGGRGLAIVANEALWIGLPTLLALGLAQLARRRARYRAGS